MIKASPFIPRAKRYARQRLRRGATLLETSIVLLILISALSVGAVIYYNYLENRTNHIAAEEMRLVSSAFGLYLDDNYGAVLDETKAAGNRFTVPFQRLKDGAYLFNTFENINPFRQNYNLATRYIPAIGGQSERLESIVYTTGGDVISGKNALTIAQLIGAGGGYTIDPETTPGSTSEVKSTMGGYELNTQVSYGVNPGAGKLVSAMFFDDAGAIVSDFLYRNAVPNRPELNMMNTDINMGDNNIDNAQRITTVFADVNEHLNAGTAKVDGYLSAGGERLANNNLTVHGTSRLEGDVGVGGQSQAGQKLNVHGNTRVDGTLLVTDNADVAKNVYSNDGWFINRAGSTGWRNDRFGGGWYMTDSTWLRVYGGKSIYTTGGIQIGGDASIGGNLTVDGSITGQDVTARRDVIAGRNVRLKGVLHFENAVSEGGSCTAGTVSRNAAGLLLSCQSGRWKTQGSYEISHYSVSNSGRNSSRSLNLGQHKFCALSANRSPSAGAASCHVSGSTSWTLSARTDTGGVVPGEGEGGLYDGNFCDAVCFK